MVTLIEKIKEIQKKLKKNEVKLKDLWDFLRQLRHNEIDRESYYIMLERIDIYIKYAIFLNKLKKRVIWKIGTLRIDYIEEVLVELRAIGREDIITEYKKHKGNAPKWLLKRIKEGI